MIWNGSGLTTATGVYVGLFIIAGAPGVVLETGVISLLQLASRDELIWPEKLHCGHPTL